MVFICNIVYGSLFEILKILAIIVIICGMEENVKTPIYVIGHRNPDTGSAVCYARFKTIITGECYIPKRAGHLNEETQFVFKNLGIKPPEYMRDVRPQVKDVDIHFVEGVMKIFQ